MSDCDVQRLIASEVYPEEDIVTYGAFLIRQHSLFSHLCAAMMLICFASGMRGLNCRRLRLKGLRHFDAEGIGEGHYWYLTLIDIETKRIHQTGKMLLHLILPHRKVELCAVIRTALSIIATYSLHRRPVPDFNNPGKGGWRDHPLLPGRGIQADGGCPNPVDGKTHLNHFKDAFAQTEDGPSMLKMLEATAGGHHYIHGLRNSHGTALRAAGCTDEHIAGVNWDHAASNIMNMAYQRRGVPKAAVASAGFHSDDIRTVVLHHLDMPPPPVEACRHVFDPIKPYELLEALLVKHRDPSTPASEIDCSLENFLRLLCKLAELVLRGLGAGLMEKQPKSPLWQLPFALRKDVRQYIIECQTIHLTQDACRARVEAAHLRVHPDSAHIARHLQQLHSLILQQSPPRAMHTATGLTSPTVQLPADLCAPSSSVLDAAILSSPTAQRLAEPSAPSSSVLEDAHPGTTCALFGASGPLVSESVLPPSPSRCVASFPGLGIHQFSVASVVKEWFHGSDTCIALKNNGDKAWRDLLVKHVTNPEDRARSRGHIRDAIAARKRLMKVLAPDGTEPSSDKVAGWQKMFADAGFKSIAAVHKAIKERRGIFSRQVAGPP